jgi:hypothetical protein
MFRRHRASWNGLPSRSQTGATSFGGIVQNRDARLSASLRGVHGRAALLEQLLKPAIDVVAELAAVAIPTFEQLFRFLRH